MSPPDKRHIVHRQGIETVVYDDDIYAELGRYHIGKMDTTQTAQRIASQYHRMSEKGRKTYLHMLEVESKKARNSSNTHWSRRVSRIGFLESQERYGDLPGDSFGHAILGDLLQISRDAIGKLENLLSSIPKNQRDGLITRLEKEGRVLARRKIGPNEKPAIYLLNNGMVIIEEK